MAPKKRTSLKPKPSSNESGSSQSKASVARAQDRRKDTVKINSDLTLYLRLLIIVLIILAVGGFLLYPDILHLVKVFNESKDIGIRSAEQTRESTPEKQFLNKRDSSLEDDDARANTESDQTKDVESRLEVMEEDLKEEDLMKEEIEENEKQNNEKRLKLSNLPNKKIISFDIKQESDNSIHRRSSNNKKPDTVNEKPSSADKSKKEEQLHKTQNTDSKEKDKFNDKKINTVNEKSLPTNARHKDEKLVETQKVNKENEKVNDKNTNTINKKSSTETNKKDERLDVPQKDKDTEKINDKKINKSKKKSSSIDSNSKENRLGSRVEDNKAKKSGPILLNAKNNHVVLDPSQIKIVDSSSSSSSSSSSTSSSSSSSNKQDNAAIHNKDKKSPKSSSSQKAEKSAKTASDPNKTKKAKNDGENIDVREEAKNFNAIFQNRFTPKKIFADGRRIPPMELLHQKKSNSSVRVFLFDDFLSEAECDGLIKAHDSHVKALNKPPILCFDSVTTLRKHISDAKKNINVTPRDFTKGTRCVNSSFSLQLQEWMKSNWSYSTAFYPGESTFSKIAAYRIKEAMGLDPASGGKFQITSYPEGKAYKEHTDCTLGGKDQRDRVVSVLMYLSNVEEGGETTFPELGIWVRPKKGRAIVWNNMSPDGVCEEHSKHVASVVKKGSKYILIRWYYYKTFYSLGQRPEPPYLPERDPDQPMVSCDEYDSGSCRWYDEWQYHVLLDYQKHKFQLN